MTRDMNVDQVLDDWFTEGPTHLPDRTVAAIVDRLDGVPRHGRIGPMGRIQIRRLSVVAALVAVIAASALAASNLASIGRSATASSGSVRQLARTS